jgi:TolB-like protein
MAASLIEPDGRELRRLRFGTFEVDLRERELYNRGMRVGLQQKPFRILELLLRKRGALVTREELAQYLWPNLHVSFDRGLNTAVNVLRRALGDSPSNCRYIETRSGLGYRFIAPVEEIGPAARDSALDSIAVLPFEPVGGDSALAQLADGITEGLIARLAGMRHVRVIARTTVFQMRGLAADASTAGSKLNVRTVLTGRVARERDLLRVSSELVEAASGRRLWGDQYSTVPMGVFAIEKQICAAISEFLAAPAHPEPITADRGLTANLEAYQDYLRGRFFYGKMNEEDLRRSIGYFESAVRQDSGYALAYTGLANAYSLLAVLGAMPSAAARGRVAEFVTAALQIDPKLAEGHASLAGLKKLFEWDWAGAEQEYVAALELNPNYSDGRHWYAAFLCAIGRGEEALTEMRRAQDLDPLSLVISAEAAWTRYMCRDFQGAVEQSWQALALEPRFAAAQHTLGLACEQLGMHEEALTEFENARTCSGGHPSAIAALAHAHASCGNRDQALRTLGELQQMSQRRRVSPYWMSVVHTGLGAPERALESLEKAIEERDVWLLWMKVEPRFDPIRSDPRFQRALQQVGLE